MSHALLSASSAHRWLACSPSARLEQHFSDQSGTAAAEGSAAHALAEYKLKSALGIKAERATSEFDSRDMEDYTDGYVAYVLEILEGIKETCSDPKVLIEQKLDLSNFVPEGFGTGDCVIIADETVHVIDFKYGQGVLVNAEENPQMMLYGLGAVELMLGIFELSEDAKVFMTIYQPRRDHISTYALRKDELYAWAHAYLAPAAELAFSGCGDFVPGSHCQFCKAAIKCRARADMKLELAKYEFKRPPLLEDSDIEEILGQLDELTSWANDIKAYALEAAAHHGKRWRGLKLVEGRATRRFTDEGLVAQAAKAAGFSDIYSNELKSLTELEKLMTKQKFQEVLGAFIVKPPGKPALVPLTDKRPEMQTAAKYEFMEE